MVIYTNDRSSQKKINKVLGKQIYQEPKIFFSIFLKFQVRIIPRKI